MEQNIFKVHSSAFKDGQEIPEKFTADGKNISPPLEWNEIPNVKEYALICEDPDAPKEAPFIHWVAYGIPAGQHQLDEAEDKGFVEGRNSQGDLGYTGPKPPPETGDHRYYFRLFALDEEMNLQSGLTKDELMDVIEPHILSEADVMGKYRYH